MRERRGTNFSPLTMAKTVATIYITPTNLTPFSFQWRLKTIARSLAIKLVKNNPASRLTLIQLEENKPTVSKLLRCIESSFL